MVRNIEIKETIIDKSSEFNIKRFRIGDLNINRPTKIIDAKKITKELFEKEGKMFQKIPLGNSKSVLLENSKYVSASSINKILDETDDKRIKRMFEFENWFAQYPHVLSLTFKFNPYREYRKLENMSGYFEYFYNFSDPFLLIPNIKIEQYDINTKKKVEIITIDDYLKFVEETYQILNYKNGKPIFAPISLKLSIDDIKKLAKKYIQNEYFYFWFDFEGSAITKPKIARIRAFLREININQRSDDIILYSTNIKREMMSNIKSEKSPSSDILASLVGSNLIGINREPTRPPINIPLNKEEVIELRKHKARIFDPITYYYLKIDASNHDANKKNKLMDTKYNILFNSNLLDCELTSQTEYFLEKMNIKEYITKKQMVKEYKDGELIKDLFHRERKITDWF